MLRHVHGRLRRVTVFKTIVLAEAQYVILGGDRALITVTLQHSAQPLAHAHKHTISVRASATIHGGTTVSRTVTLAPAPQPRHRR